jgi:hypothetical protein
MEHWAELARPPVHQWVDMKRWNFETATPTYMMGWG